jgi:hypothetical protein
MDEQDTKARDFCRSLLERPEYRKALEKAMDDRTVAPEVEELIWHYALSAPIARHAVTLNDRDNVLSLVKKPEIKDDRM